LIDRGQLPLELGHDASLAEDDFLVGEGNRLEVDASPAIIHRQLTVLGSWVTSVGHMEELMGLLVRWDLHPDRTVTDRFPLDQAETAYRTADGGERGKVAIVMS